MSTERYNYYKRKFAWFPLIIERKICWRKDYYSHVCIAVNKYVNFYSYSSRKISAETYVYLKLSNKLDLGEYYYAPKGYEHLPDNSIWDHFV